MKRRVDRRVYRCAEDVLVRAALHAELSLPAWPDLTDMTHGHEERWCEWLRQVWSIDVVAEAIEQASPGLARYVPALCAEGPLETRRLRRAVLSITRYLLRMTGRATPFGLFAGVAPGAFGARLDVRWGDDHLAIAAPNAAWIAGAIEQLESCRPLRERLDLVANNMCVRRGGRLIVPHQLGSSRGRNAAVAVSIRCTSAVRAALDGAKSPVRWTELAAKLSAVHPNAPQPDVDGLLAELVRRRALISSLHAPFTITDTLGHLVTQLETAGADEIPEVAPLLGRLREVQADLAQHNRDTRAHVRRGIRKVCADKLAAVGASRVEPLTVDLLLDCSVVLPGEVAGEAEAAASAIARLAVHPLGNVAWQRYHNRFFDRYGVGTLVPVLDLIDANAGLGLPEGYAGSLARERPLPISARDERLLALAQKAAMDGRDEIVLDEHLIASLEGRDVARADAPPHVELCFQLHAESALALERGEFQLALVTASRGAGTMTGRFIDLLHRSDRERMVRMFGRLPTGAPDALPAQLSFPPLDPDTAHVARTPNLLPTVLSLGEHRAPDDSVLGPEDLAVTTDGSRMYLYAESLRRLVEPAILHALDVRLHTPPLARFLAEMSRAQDAVVNGFDWGVAGRLPFLPRVRHGRTILSSARWLVEGSDLPGRGASWREWGAGLQAWRARRRVPDLVYLTEGDRRLRLEMGLPNHLAILRAHLESTGNASLTEAPGPNAHGWFGDRAHEIVVPMLAVRDTLSRPAPRLDAARVRGRDDGHLPGASTWLFAKLYGHPDVQTEILAEHLQSLLSMWDETPEWWFMRYRDPECHLRLRIALSSFEEFGPAAHRVSTWVSHLRRVALLRDVQFAPYYPETGRWGTGPVMAAAEEVFGADSRALVAQFAETARPHPQALAAANFTSIASGFLGDTASGMRWLMEHGKPASFRAPDPHVRAEALRLADPSAEWASLRAVPGGRAIAGAWEPRRRSLARYRALAGAEGRDVDLILTSLLHGHHIRAVGIDRDDECTCLHLARAAALAWDARSSRGGKR